MVLDYSGRIYLTKDARMSTETFRRGYPRWEILGQYTGAMVGEPAISVIVDAYKKGLIFDGLNNPLYYNIKMMQKINLK